MLWVIYMIWILFVVTLGVVGRKTKNDICLGLFFISAVVMFYVPFMV